MINILQRKSEFALYIIVVLTVVTIIIGCAYKEYESKRIIRIIKSNKQVIEQTIAENEKTIETEIDKGVDTNQAVEPVSLGEFKLTGYCSCKICCNGWSNNRPKDEYGNEIVYGAIGEKLKEGYSIAVDASVIPYRTEVIINGRTYKAQDCGGAIKGNRIDVYFSDHQSAINFGVQYAEVFLISN